MPTRLRRCVFVSLAGFAACLLGGCEGEDGIRAYTAPNEPPRVTPPMPAQQVAGKPVEWKLPDGWVELPDAGPNEFGRFATIQASKDDASLQLTVNRLSGPGSQDLLPNLNRWEGQFGLPATPEADAPKKAKMLEVDGHAGFRVDLTGVEQKSQTPARLLAFILPHGKEAWSFKLQGAPEKVAAQEAAFDAFVSSVRFTSHDHGDDAHAGGPTTGPAADAFSGAPPAADNKSYTIKNLTLPPNWVQDPTERPMRFATYNVGPGGGAGNEQASLIVTRLPRSGFGSIEQNINRWRGEVGLPPSSDVASEQFRQARAGGEAAVVFDFAPPAPTPDAKRSFVAIVPKGADVWFLKLIGPARTVTEQQANFEAVLQSLQFGEAGE